MGTPTHRKKNKQNHPTSSRKAYPSEHLKNSTPSLHHSTIVSIVLLPIIAVLKTTVCLPAGKQTTQSCWAHSPATFAAKGENCSLIHLPVFTKLCNRAKDTETSEMWGAALFPLWAEQKMSSYCFDCISYHYNYSGVTLLRNKTSFFH